MGTSIDYIEYVCEQINGTGMIRYKKMFGEYMVYINDKPILLVCDDTVFVKMRDEIRDDMELSETGYPYDGAKEHYILDIDNREFSQRIVQMLEPITEIPKPRKKKQK